MSSDSENILNGIIEQYSENSASIKEKLDGSKEVNSNLIQLVENIEKCKTLRDDYRTKHQQIKDLNKIFNHLSTLIKSKISVDSDLMDELVKMFSSWANNEDFAQEYGIPKEELDDLVKEQTDILVQLKTSVEELNNEEKMSLGTIENYSVEELEELVKKIEGGNFDDILQ